MLPSAKLTVRPWKNHTFLVETGASSISNSWQGRKMLIYWRVTGDDLSTDDYPVVNWWYQSSDLVSSHLYLEKSRSKIAEVDPFQPSPMSGFTSTHLIFQGFSQFSSPSGPASLSPSGDRSSGGAVPGGGQVRCGAARPARQHAAAPGCRGEL